MVAAIIYPEAPILEVQAPVVIDEPALLDVAVNNDPEQDVHTVFDDICDDPFECRMLTTTKSPWKSAMLSTSINTPRLWMRIRPIKIPQVMTMIRIKELLLKDGVATCRASNTGANF